MDCERWRYKLLAVKVVELVKPYKFAEESLRSVIYFFRLYLTDTHESLCTSNNIYKYFRGVFFHKFLYHKRENACEKRNGN